MQVIELEISRFPYKERPYMPGSQTTQGRLDTRDDVPDRVAFRETYLVGALRFNTFAAQWLAYTIPCRRFAYILADACARLGANVDRYSFTATDSHRLLLAGLPAHKSAVFDELHRLPALFEQCGRCKQTGGADQRGNAHAVMEPRVIL
jgi:hypothetical protein